MNTYRRQKQQEARQMVVYGLLVAVVGAGMMYGELTAWDSLIGFVPGVVIWPLGIAMGLVLLVSGLKDLIHH
jgi:hypothetical protein